MRQEHTYEVATKFCKWHRDIVSAFKNSEGGSARAIMEMHICESGMQTLEHFDRLQREEEHTTGGIERFQLPDERLEEFDRMGVSLDAAKVKTKQSRLRKRKQ